MSLPDIAYEEDDETLEKLKGLYPDFGSKVVSAWNRFHKAHGLRSRMTDGHRSFASQDLLYEMGRKTRGRIVTHSKGGESFHNYGLACDVAFRGMDPYLQCNPNSGALWKAYGDALNAVGLVWGGNFKSLKDNPHAECSYGFSTKDLFEIHKTSGLLGVWEAIDRRRGVPVGSEWADRREWLISLKGN